MAKLTSKQANELANCFLTMAQAIGDYRVQNFDTFSAAQNQNLKDLLAAIRKYADELFTLSAMLVLDDVETALASIGEVTNQMKSTCKTLQDIQKAINIAASLVTLGESFASKNPKAIADAIGGLAGTLKA